MADPQQEGFDDNDDDEELEEVTKKIASCLGPLLLRRQTLEPHDKNLKSLRSFGSAGAHWSFGGIAAKKRPE
jgi:hypothetical protein